MAHTGNARWAERDSTQLNKKIFDFIFCFIWILKFESRFTLKSGGFENL
jgi:hypothetical protein